MVTTMMFLYAARLPYVIGHESGDPDQRYTNSETMGVNDKWY